MADLHPDVSDFLSETVRPPVAANRPVHVSESIGVDVATTLKIVVHSANGCWIGVTFHLNGPHASSYWDAICEQVEETLNLDEYEIPDEDDDTVPEPEEGSLVTTSRGSDAFTAQVTLPSEFLFRDGAIYSVTLITGAKADVRVPSEYETLDEVQEYVQRKWWSTFSDTEKLNQLKTFSRDMIETVEEKNSA